MTRTPIITVDGPEASGKGTLARRLAEALEFYYLDTGAIYRTVALRLLRAGIDPDNADAAGRAAQDIAATFDAAMLTNPDIRTGEVGQAASKSAQHPGVRAALLDIQRNLAKNPPAPHKGAVLDGRDTGTVVCPDADLKVFLTAAAAKRAERRTKELQSKGLDVTYEAVLQALEERDTRDATRAVAPLRPAQDAAMVDTTEMDADEALAAVLALVQHRLQGS